VTRKGRARAPPSSSFAFLSYKARELHLTQLNDKRKEKFHVPVPRKEIKRDMYYSSRHNKKETKSSEDLSLSFFV